MTVTLYRPTRAELAFRAAWLADPATMRYNRAWGGTIAFPEENRDAWYARWIGAPADGRFYRYLCADGRIVGEAAYHPEDGLWLADVLIRADERGHGYGRAGLRLLCAAAREAGISVLHDRIASDNPALSLFLSEGFAAEARTAERVLVAKRLLEE